MILEEQSEGVTVVYGQRDGIRVGHVIFAINGTPVYGKKMSDKTDVMAVSLKVNKYQFMYYS